MILLGLTGGKGVGKSTLAEALVTHHGYERLAFAGPLKRMLTAANMAPNLDFEHLTTEEKETPIPGLEVTPRHLMQTLGTEWMRRCVREDGWLWLMEQELLRRFGSDLPGVVIDDIRFDNEAELVRRLGGSVVGLWRNAMPKNTDKHVSEAGVARHLHLMFKEVPPNAAKELADELHELLLWESAVREREAQRERV